ncbi:MAG: hypothetical protein LBI63_03390 [Candidatus Ancillula sp.]|jgi:hypothetical protein|nr:hypothetical protein [Candidatus Ancillula sp.]
MMKENEQYSLRSLFGLVVLLINKLYSTTSKTHQHDFLEGGVYKHQPKQPQAKHSNMIFWRKFHA